MSLLLSWLAVREHFWLWLVLPLGFFFDSWYQTSLGLSGMKILLIFLIFWWFYGRRQQENSKIKI